MTDPKESDPWKPYKTLDDDGVAVHHLIDSWVAYIDELGTKARMKNYSDQQLACDIRELSQALEGLPFQSDEEHLVARFTDNIVIGISDWVPLNLFLRPIAEYQLQLALNGRLVRGAVTFGQHHSSDSYVGGPALVEAASLEETLAIFPRIIVTSACIENGRTAGWPNLPQRSRIGGNEVKISVAQADEFVTAGDDGVKFVHYLAVASHESIGAHGKKLESLSREAVKSSRPGGKSEPRHIQKIRWVISYHNRTCREKGLAQYVVTM